MTGIWKTCEKGIFSTRVILYYNLATFSHWTEAHYLTSDLSSMIHSHELLYFNGSDCMFTGRDISREAI
jgi:hypothetical protein